MGATAGIHYWSYDQLWPVAIFLCLELTGGMTVKYRKRQPVAQTFVCPTRDSQVQYGR